MGNDLVTEVKDSENIWTGSRLLEDGFDLKEAFESKSWVAGGLAVAATTADAVSAAMDPLGEAMSAGVAWVIEHLGSLNKWLNELTGDSDAVAAAASTWTNIATKLNSCADDLEAVCTGRLAGQESLAVATFKSLQAGSASHLRMTGGVAGAISGGLTVASVIVRMVHDLVRDAISDVIGKLLSKATITVITAGLAAPWVVQSVISDVASWVTRLSKDIASTVLSAKNLKNLLDKATTLLDDVAAAFARIPAKASEAVTKKVEAAKDLASSLSPQHALAGAPGMTMAQARQAGKASPTVHTPKNPRPSRPNPNEGRWGRRLDETTDTTKHTDEAAEAATTAATAKTKSEPVNEYADRGDGRDIKGRYAKDNGGAHMYDDSEAKGLEEYLDDLDADGVSVNEVIEYKRLARIEGAPQGRYYDRLVQREDGTWVGLEVKSGGSSYSGTQREADNMVSPDNPAVVTLDDGRTIKVTEVQVKRVERQQ